MHALLPTDDVNELLLAYEKTEGIELNPQQWQAVHLGAAKPFALITGGAGVGKTTVLKALYDVYDRAGIAVTQLALAGRAAKRMQEATGRPASTIASFLRSSKEGSLDERSVVIIDEASMVDIITMSRLCELLGPAPRMVLGGGPRAADAGWAPAWCCMPLHRCLKCRWRSSPWSSATVVPSRLLQPLSAKVAGRHCRTTRLQQSDSFLAPSVLRPQPRLLSPKPYCICTGKTRRTPQVLCARRNGLDGAKGPQCAVSGGAHCRCESRAGLGRAP